MELFFKICMGVSVGIVIGVLLGVIKMKFRKKLYSKKQIELNRKFLKKVASIVKYITIIVLSVGFVWCVYFLVLGIVRPEQANYANNIAELIVAVLTVISIIFAFVEFLKMMGEKEKL